MPAVFVLVWINDMMRRSGHASDRITDGNGGQTIGQTDFKGCLRVDFPDLLLNEFALPQ